MTNGKKPEHAAKLRGDIDTGKAGDKIGFPDPAAAPLGTDAEAGGASPSPEEVRKAHRHEVERHPSGPAAASDPRQISSRGASPFRRRGWIAILMIIGLVLTGFLLFYAVLQCTRATFSSSPSTRYVRSCAFMRSCRTAAKT